MRKSKADSQGFLTALSVTEAAALLCIYPIAKAAVELDGVLIRDEARTVMHEISIICIFYYNPRVEQDKLAKLLPNNVAAYLTLFSQLSISTSARTRPLAKSHLDKPK